MLLFLLGFLSLGALAGGGALLLSPDGKLIQLPSIYLENSPFNSYFIPGAVLFLILGLMPLLLIIALVKKRDSKLAERLNLLPDMQWPWTYSIYMGFAVIIWIQLQIAIIQVVFWMQTFFVFWGLGIIAIALLPSVRNLYRK